MLYISKKYEVSIHAFSSIIILLRVPGDFIFLQPTVGEWRGPVLRALTPTLVVATPIIPVSMLQ